MSYTSWTAGVHVWKVTSVKCADQRLCAMGVCTEKLPADFDWWGAIDDNAIVATGLSYGTPKLSTLASKACQKWGNLLLACSVLLQAVARGSLLTCFGLFQSAPFANN